jgi:hypothetical protein
MHGFYTDTKAKTIHFDVVISFDVDSKEALETLSKQTKEMYPDYSVMIVPDSDISD